MKSITIVEPGSGQDPIDVSLEQSVTVRDVLLELGKDPKQWNLTPVGDTRVLDVGQDLFQEAAEGQKFHLVMDSSVGLQGSLSGEHGYEVL